MDLKEYANIFKAIGDVTRLFIQKNGLQMMNYLLVSY